jgi:hypothetical protein
MDEPQRDLDVWIALYNEARPHQGRWCFGKIPMRTFLDLIPIALEKQLAPSVNQCRRYVGAYGFHTPCCWPPASSIQETTDTEDPSLDSRTNYRPIQIVGVAYRPCNPHLVGDWLVTP